MAIKRESYAGYVGYNSLNTKKWATDLIYGLRRLRWLHKEKVTQTPKSYASYAPMEDVYKPFFDHPQVTMVTLVTYGACRLTPSFLYYIYRNSTVKEQKRGVTHSYTSSIGA